jgi:quercetin dioxygenase-like cupin family protein
MVVFQGRITLGLDDGEHALGPGDAVIQRGTVHRWRVVGREPCTFLSVLMSVDPAATAPPVQELAARTPADPADEGPHRLVTGTNADGRSGVTRVGPAPGVHAGEVAIHDLWQTGGRLAQVEQGGDAPGPWALEPAGGGVALRRVEFAAGHDSGAGGIHATATIDVGLVLSGELELALPSNREWTTFDATILGPGDVVIQRGTLHRWRPVGPEPAVLVSVMISIA